MHMQLAVLCLFGVSLVVANGYGDQCFLSRCGLRPGVFYVTVTPAGGPTAYQVLTFQPDGFFSGFASDGGTAFSNYQGTWKCTGRNTVEATDFLFVFANGPSAARLSKGIFKLRLGPNDQVTGVLNATNYDLTSTQNPDQSKWVQVFKIDFEVKGYKLLNGCDS